MDNWTDRQNVLKLLGYDPGPIDGEFGPKTRKALQEFQLDEEITPDGIWGPKTEAALRYCLEEKL